jgi:hypothetical protein
MVNHNRMTNNTMHRSKRTKRQTMTYKIYILHRKHKIEQQQTLQNTTQKTPN